MNLIENKQTIRLNDFKNEHVHKLYMGVAGYKVSVLYFSFVSIKRTKITCMHRLNQGHTLCRIDDIIVRMIGPT